jgi:hypothetical protein
LPKEHSSFASATSHACRPLPTINHDSSSKLKIRLIISQIIILSFFGCKKYEVIPVSDYNEKASDLIEQVIIDNSRCNCLLKISNKSTLQIYQEEIPIYPIKKTLAKRLELPNESSLDSLIYLSKNFKLNKDILKRHNIKLITHETLMLAKKDINICPKGILCIQKPIFDKSYKTAVINVNWAFVCSPGYIAIYKFKNGKWIAE